MNGTYGQSDLGDHHSQHSHQSHAYSNGSQTSNAGTSAGARGPTFNIFVGDLAPDVDTPTLLHSFTPFGEIQDCRVVRDPQSNKSRCYGFVSFVQRADAENAIVKMNGAVLGGRTIRTNWASRKPPASRAENGVSMPGQGLGMPGISGPIRPTNLTFEEILQQTPASNCTVYCGGLFNGLCDELIQRLFRPYGTITEVRVFKEKGYAFIRFANKESAAHAISQLHNQEVHGQMIKCSWGKGDQEPGSGAQGMPGVPGQNSANHAAAVAGSNMNPSALAVAAAAMLNHHAQHPAAVNAAMMNHAQHPGAAAAAANQHAAAQAAAAQHAQMNAHHQHHQHHQNAAATAVAANYMYNPYAASQMAQMASTGQFAWYPQAMAQGLPPGMQYPHGIPVAYPPAVNEHQYK